MDKPKSRREAIKSQKPVYAERDNTPIEIPASRKTIPDTKAMVRQYVHQALRQAGATEGYESAEEMMKEELDLDPEDPDPPWVSQYEVTEMEDIVVPLEEAPPEEGETQEEIPIPEPEIKEPGETPG